jgi:hypothetical protein
MTQPTCYVSLNPKLLYLAQRDKGWVGQYGYIVVVEELEFTAVPHGNDMLVSDFLSGGRIFKLPLPEPGELPSREDDIAFIAVAVGARLISILSKVGVEKYQQIRDETYADFCESYGPNPMFEEV